MKLTSALRLIAGLYAVALLAVVRECGWLDALESWRGAPAQRR